MTHVVLNLEKKRAWLETHKLLLFIYGIAYNLAPKTIAKSEI